jgi:AraC family transcriptional regulator of adaptative response/methylated-DNA-[protein]-cysteine methyltransferase
MAAFINGKPSGAYISAPAASDGGALLQALHRVRERRLSPHHFHRIFKTVTGVTPRAYAFAERSRRVRDGLADASTVTAAIYDAGFNSGGRFYEQSSLVLGMTPTRFRNGGERTTIRFAIGESSLGATLVAATDKGVCALLLGDDPDVLAKDLQDRFNRAELVGGDVDFEALVAKVVGLVEHPRVGQDLPLDVRGMAFQQKVWKALCDIKVGDTAKLGQNERFDVLADILEGLRATRQEPLRAAMVEANRERLEAGRPESSDSAATSGV